MKRKVSKIGQSTLMVSLPHTWVKEHGIEKGDEVEIGTNGAILEISKTKDKKKEKKECSIECNSTYEKVIRMQLNNLYRIGYDRIYVSFKDKKTITQLRHIVSQYLLGFEIVHEEENQCVIESLTEPEPERAETLMRKVFFILIESFHILLEDMKKKEFERLDEFKELMIRTDRFCNFYSRTLSKEKHLNPFLWSMVQQLLKTEHSLYYCYKVISESSFRRFNKDIITYIENSFLIARALEGLYYKQSEHDIERIVKLRDELLYRQLPLIQNTKEGIFVAPFLFDIVKQMPVGRTFGLLSIRK